LSQRLGTNGNAVAKDDLAALPADERGNADNDRIGPSRNTPAQLSHGRSRAAERLRLSEGVGLPRRPWETTRAPTK
jgi:hypothetical protein